MALSARPIPIPSRDTQLPPPAVIEVRADREKRDMGAAASLFVAPAPSHPPGQITVGAVAASPLAPPREPPRRACEHTNNRAG